MTRYTASALTAFVMLGVTPAAGSVRLQPDLSSPPEGGHYRRGPEGGHHQVPRRRTLRTALVAFVMLGVTAAVSSAQQQQQQQQQPASTAAPEQQRATTHELVLRDGSRLYGTIERENDVEVVFRTQAGAIVTARRADIASLEKVTGTVSRGEFMRADPNATRLFFGPTGRAMEKGQVYVGVYGLLMPFVQVGITDRLSIGGGTPLIFGIDDWNRPFWITPKLQVFHSSSTNISVGALHAFDTDGEGGGIGYVVGTRGGSDASVTAGAGLAYGNDGKRAGVVMVGGERRVRRNLKLITENYVWRNGNGIASAGVRFLGDRLSADLALLMPLGMDDTFVFPFVNFVYVF